MNSFQKADEGPRVRSSPRVCGADLPNPLRVRARRECLFASVPYWDRALDTGDFEVRRGEPGGE